MNNPLVQPDPGLYIWTIVTFLVLVALLAKFAELGDMAVQVDDFPSDFGLAENLQKFQQGAQTPATREAAE